MSTTIFACQIDDDIWQDTLGKIIEGDDCGHYIKIEHNPKVANGYFIFQSSSKSFDSHETFDAWVQDIESLKQFFRQSSWKVLWLFEKAS
jgi:hypothetical protein